LLSNELGVGSFDGMGAVEYEPAPSALRRISRGTGAAPRLRSAPSALRCPPDKGVISQRPSPLRRM
jgi:hypothetical protein